MTTLSEKEIKLVGKLRDRVKNDVADDFSLKDCNLIVWLRNNSNNLDKAEKAIYKNLHWRKEQQIDNWVIEDFSEVIIRNVPYRVHGHDKEGRPVKITHVGAVDAQELTNGNYLEECSRYICFGAENASKAIRRNQNTIGLKEGTFLDIIDLEGITYSKGFTKPYFSQLLTCVRVLEPNYSHLAYKHIIINAPSFVNNFFKIIKLILSQNTKNRIFVFGSDKSEWIPFLLEHIPEDQLSPRYGGTLVMDNK